MTRIDAPVAMSLEPRRRRSLPNWAPLAMVTPFVLLFLIFFVFPIIYSIVVSFTSARGGEFVGLKNYEYFLTRPEFWDGLFRVIYFGVIQVSVMIGAAILLALFLDSPYVRGKRFFSTVYFIPYAVPAVIATIMWGFLFTPQLNSLLDIPHALGLTSGPIQPLDSDLVLYAIMFIVTWSFTGYNMTIYMTSLSSIPREVIDAARIDGASEVQIARMIKLPYLRNTLIFTLVLSIIGTLQLFNEPSVLSRLAPLGSSYTPNMLIYTTAFSLNNIPVAAAMSVVLALVTVFGTVVFFRVVRPRKSRAVRAERKAARS